MEKVLQDSEIKIMNVLWDNGEMKAKDIAALLKERVGWNVNTTYTLIKRCIGKGAIERTDPGFLCRPLIGREQIQQYETKQLVDKVFSGSMDMLFSSILSQKGLDEDRIQKLKELIDSME